MHSNTVRYIRNLYRSSGTIPLHAPRFIGNEQKYLGNCIETAEVSGEGEYVARFEAMVRDYSGARYAVAFNSSESALRVALALAGTQEECEVLTQPLAFAGTANTISSFGAVPVFIDVERRNMGMDPDRLKEFLAYNAEVRDDGCYNRHTKRRITACVPVHTLGFPCRVDDLKVICDNHNISMIEDASDAFGSLYKGKMAGRYGRFGIYGFEGHKIVTCGDGGVLVCDDEAMAQRAKLFGDSPSLSHPLDAPQGEGRFANRMSNLNAAVGCAQMEHIHTLVAKQRELARRYRDFFETADEEVIVADRQNQTNCWLNALLFESPEARDTFVRETNAQGVNTRPLWPLVSDLSRYRECLATDLSNARFLQEHIATLPSGVR